MEKQVLQIESIGAEEILNRLERIESAILNNSNSPQPTPSIEDELITRKDVAKMLRVSLVTISDWVDKGVLKAYKMGNRVYFKPEEIKSSLVRKGGLYAIR